jgi:endonuclease/exonuclease/phosphatase family metal-dependent hydrolase
MRLVSYNILDGGEGRADPLAEVIEAQRPDVVVLVEADHPEVTERIARRLNMDVITGAGPRHSAAILSHWPIRDSINHGLLKNQITGSFLVATIESPHHQRWSIAAIHLHPHAADADETIRESEIEVILNTFKPHRENGWPHLLAGDFNANSPIQKIDPAQCKPRTREEWIANGNQLPRRAIQKLLDTGYLDLLAAFHGEKAGTMGSFTTQFPGQRVDYVFAHGVEARQIRAAHIETDRLAKYASDHFPVFIEID